MGHQDYVATIRDQFKPPVAKGNPPKKLRQLDYSILIGGTAVTRDFDVRNVRISEGRPLKWRDRELFNRKQESTYFPRGFSVNYLYRAGRERKKMALGYKSNVDEKYTLTASLSEPNVEITVNVERAQVGDFQSYALASRLHERGVLVAFRLQQMKGWTAVITEALPQLVLPRDQSADLDAFKAKAAAEMGRVGLAYEPPADAGTGIGIKMVKEDAGSVTP